MLDFTVGLVQMAVAPDLEACLGTAREGIEAAVEAGADLVVLPEMFACPYDLDHFGPRAEPLHGSTCRFLSATASRLGVHLVGGSFPERLGEAVHNTATVWSPSGELLAVHRKVHLFDVDIPGGISFRESERLAAGDRIEAVTIDLARIGLGVCYDLRFPEQFRRLALAGAELIVLPGAFNTTTGPAHWRPLLRARAIENTCWVAACSPVPHQEGDYPAWGHSMVVDPFGEVLAEAGRDEAVITARLEAARLTEVRRALPVLEQRRPEVYGREPAAEPEGEPER